MKRLAIDALPSPVNFDGSSQINIDYTLPADRYASGGEIIVKDGQFGDYITAQVCLPNGTMAVEYVHKIFLRPIMSGYFQAFIDGGELDTLVPSGFILRVVYNSVGTVSRSALVNYNFTIKL